MPKLDPLTSRLLKQRQDTLLNAVECGSVDHIYDLENEWPEELPAAKRAVLAVFRHLDEMTIRLRPGGHHGSSEKLAHDIALLRPCLGSFDGLLRLMDSGNVGTNYCRQVLSLVWEHLSSLITGLDFSSRYSHIINADRADANARHFGNVAGSLMVRKFYDFTLKYPEPEEQGKTSLTAMVHYIFKCWLRGVKDEPPPEDTTQTPAEYTMCPAPLFNSLWRVIDEDIPREILLERVRGLDDKSMKLLAESFGYRMVEWAKIHKPQTLAEARNLDCGNLVAFVTASQELSVVPRLYHALIKARFTTLAMKVGQEFKESRSREKCGGSVLTAIATQFIPPRRHLAYELSHIIPELLEAGLLKVIIDDLLSPGDKTFQRWWRKNPLLHVSELFHHPQVVKALVPAWASLPDSLVAALKAIPEHGSLWDLVDGGSYCARLVAEAFERGDSEIVDNHFCDCLEHHHIRGYVRVSQVQECSCCKTVVYCSPECQKRDWDMFHKHACRRDRVHRIECQLNGAWLSYETRRRYLHWVKMLYKRCAISLPHPSKNHEFFGDRRIFHTDGFNIPSKLTAYSPDEFMRSPVLAELFGDQRSRAMVQGLREGAEENIYLMTAQFRYGQYFIVLMSKFYFHRHALRRDGTEVNPTVVLLNGYVYLKGPYGKERG